MALIHRLELLTQRGIAVVCIIVFALLQGCAPAQPLLPKGPGGLRAELPAGFFVPSGFFSKPVNDPKQSSVSAAISTAVKPSAVPSPSRAPLVLLYASPETNSYFATGGLDAKVNIQLWEVFLRKYKIPFQMLTSVGQLEKVQPGVLLLPSSVALSEREKQAVIGFRAKGGGVLASWLTGVRNENGDWRGFGFMEDALDVKVVGNTEADGDDNFMMPFGDSPVTHYLPAGLRIWLERAKEWHPLRLVGQHPAAQIMDWSRTEVAQKSGAAIVFDERRQSSGLSSRSVVLGYPERLWLSADPKLVEAIAHNALLWLLRQPDAYLAAWPAAYGSAVVLAVVASEVIADSDVELAKRVKDAGGRATYYVLSNNTLKSAENLRKLQAMGHEIAYLGDRFDDFRNQPSTVQAQRLDRMRQETKAAGIDLAADAGFHAPMESYDKTTPKLLTERAFGHYVAAMDASDTRLPLVDPSAAGTAKPLIVLPRTQRGIEEVLVENYHELGVKVFLDEFDRITQMAGLSIITIPGQTLVTHEEWGEIFAHWNARHERLWWATAGQVADWWRERERVSIRLEPGAVAMQLNVTIRGDTPLKQAVAVWVNLPEFGSTLRLIHRGSKAVSPKIIRVDAWRAAVVLEGLAAGEYRWNLYFDQPTAGRTNP